MIKIAIITPFPVTQSGGVEKFTLLLTELLTESGHYVKLFDISILDDKKYTGIFTLKKLGQYKLAYDLAKKFASEQDNFDVAICNGMYGWKVNFPRTIVIAHGNIGDYADSSKKGMTLLSYLKTRYIDVWMQTKSFKDKNLVVVSTKTGEECKKYNKIKTYTVIENAVDENKFQPKNNKTELRKKYNLPLDAFLGLFTGRPEYRKGFDIIAKTSKLLPPKHKIVVATPHSITCPENIVSIVNMPYDDIQELYNACDYFYLPSRHEGCSISLLEAMACGLPVITTVVGNGLDIANNEPKLGKFIFDSYDPAGFIEAILLLASNTDIRIETGRLARDYILKNNVKSVFAKRYNSLIKDIVSKNIG